ncbi:MAG: hypothetical protein GC200_09550 [Tepidisphaera sp.]|nr:hypothetical protein [Tepidisphaera sp.]
MSRYNTILVPTAFSKLSQLAAPYVIPLAKQFGSKVHVVHIVPQTELAVPSATPSMGGAMSMPLAGPSREELMSMSRAHLDTFCGSVLGEIAGQITKWSTIGPIVDEIVAYSERHKVDLIVMGTHADGMLKRLVFGSIGKSVLESSMCPVMLVPVRGAKV